MLVSCFILWISLPQNNVGTGIQFCQVCILIIVLLIEAVFAVRDHLGSLDVDGRVTLNGY
jgi:hypothetical protein